MLARRHRLVKEKDFEKIFKRGKSFYTKLLGIKILANELAANRFGIIVSSKISKKASARNRLKRQIRQAARELDQELRPGFDLVIMVLPGFLRQDYKTIKSELEKIFTKLRFFKQPK